MPEDEAWPDLPVETELAWEQCDAVEDGLRTGVGGVGAAGDAAQAWNTAAGRRLAIEHCQDAFDQGKIAGASAAGAAATWHGVPGFWSTIGEDTVKYHAWGDGYQRSRILSHPDGFTVWYEADDAVVGVLTTTPTTTTTSASGLSEISGPHPCPCSETSHEKSKSSVGQAPTGLFCQPGYLTPEITELGCAA